MSEISKLPGAALRAVKARQDETRAIIMRGRLVANIAAIDLRDGRVKDAIRGLREAHKHNPAGGYGAQADELEKSK